jgi:hypothetical protein
MDDKLDRIKAIGFTPAGHWEVAEKGIVCELGDFATTCNALYAFVIDGELMYVGKTVAKSPLRARLAGYRNPAASQSTNIKNNRNIRETLDQGKRVEIYVLPDRGLFYYGGFHLNLAAGLEDSLVRELDPPWNGGQKDSPDAASTPAAPATPTPPTIPNEANAAVPSPRTQGRAESKYAPLRDHLAAKRDLTRVRLTFAEIETVVGEPLPRSARIYPEWWANQANVANRPQARAWTEAGFAVEDFDQTQGWVEFVRGQRGLAG